MNVLLGEFEKEIVPLIPPGHQEVIDQFKRLAREKINGVAYEGVRATEREPGDSVSRQTTDLAERLAFQDQEDVNP